MAFCPHSHVLAHEFIISCSDCYPFSLAVFELHAIQYTSIYHEICYIYFLCMDLNTIFCTFIYHYYCLVFRSCVVLIYLWGFSTMLICPSQNAGSPLKGSTQKGRWLNQHWAGEAEDFVCPGNRYKCNLDLHQLFYIIIICSTHTELN